MSALGILSGPRRGALGEEKKIFTTAGREYWVDLFDRRGEDIEHPIDQRAYFADWLKRTNAAFPGSVKVLVHETGNGSSGWLGVGKELPWEWVKFRTNVSVPWSPISMGIPSAIKDGEKINTRDDTSEWDEHQEREDKKNEEELNQWGTYAKWGLVIAGAAVVAHLLGNVAKVGTLVKETVE